MSTSFYVYITTNPSKTVLYVGQTNDLTRRMIEHYHNRGSDKSFAGKFYCYNLVYWEMFPNRMQALEREKEIKGWRKEKKVKLISQTNPQLNSLNSAFVEGWPPRRDQDF